MGTCLELLNDLKAFDPEQAIVDTIVKTKYEYILRNKQQFSKGLRPSNMPIGFYSKSAGWSWYGEMKERMNPEAEGRVDLELHGQFKLGMWLKVEGKDILMSSSDWKAQKLEGMYHKENTNPLYGLNSENQTSYNYAVFLPEFMAVIEQQTGLKAG